MTDYLGVDLSDASLDIALWHDQKLLASTKLANSPAGFRALAAWYSAHSALTPPTLVREPTGGYEAALAVWAVEQGWRVVRVNPKQVRDWLRSQGRRAKTDAQDARGLAAYGAAHPALPRWSPPPAHLSELDDLLKHRETLEQLLREERQRLEQAQRRPRSSRSVVASHQRLLNQFEKELERLEQALEELLTQAEDVREVQAALEKLDGIGKTTSIHLALCFLLWHHDPSRSRSEKALTAFVGLDPQPYESGTSVRKPRRISRLGNRRLRAKLYMAALSQTRSDRNSRASEFYRRLVQRGKPKKVALVATMRKLLCWAWAVFQAEHPAPLPAIG